MKHPLWRTVAAAACIFLLSPAGAQDHSPHSAPAAKASSQTLSEGTIRRLDRAAGSVTISHGPIENLGMSAMTMTFRCKQGLVPASVKEGDRVRFRAEERDGQYPVVRIEGSK